VTFGEPLWFWAFALFPVFLALFVRNEWRREKLLRQLVAARLQDRLAGTVSIGRRRLRFAVVLLGLACVIASLAQPRLGHTWEQSKRKGRDVIIAVDCSRSMLATDLAPNRLGRAKLAAQDFIGQLQGDRIGLIAFAGSAFLQAPLTIDYGAVLNSLAELDTTIIPRGGTNIAGAITEADAAFGKGESDHRCLIIFTDGEELDADGLAAAEAQKDRIKIFTVGLGSADGSLIPLPGQDGGTAFVKDESGEIVKSKLDEDRLRKIAEVTGGFYVHLQNGPAEMQQIARDGLGQMKEQEIDARMSRRPIERYQWPLAAGLVLLVGSALISERKRPARRKSGAVAVLAALTLVGLLPPVALAKNSGVEAYEREDYKGAMGEFGRQLKRMQESEALHFNLGAAAYKTGDFGKALEAFAKAVTSADPQLRAAAEYNLGNTLFQRGKAAKEPDRKKREWKDALQHYEQALQVEPQNKNAEHNRDVVRKLLEELDQQQPPPQEQQQQDQNKDEEKKENQDQQQQSKQDQQNKDQQQKGQQQKDQQSQDSPEEKPENQPKDGSKEEKDQQGKKEEQKDGKSDSAEQPKPEKGDEKKDAKEGQKGENASPQKEGQKQETPAPSPDQPEKKREGEIQSKGEPPPNDPQQEAEAEAQAAQEGKMTEAQAKSLLESLKGEDDRVQLLKPGERRPGRAFRDW